MKVKHGVNIGVAQCVGFASPMTMKGLKLMASTTILKQTHKVKPTKFVAFEMPRVVPQLGNRHRNTHGLRVYIGVTHTADPAGHNWDGFSLGKATFSV